MSRVVFYDSDGNEVEVGTITYTRKQTNADRIRSMTDEELAEEMGANIDRCPPPSTICPKGGCKDCWIDWLKQEVTANDS